MRAVIQRVDGAEVNISGEEPVSLTGKGLLALVAVKPDDTQKDIEYIATKIANLRIFEDEEGKMNKSVIDIGGKVMVVPQFTLYGDCRKGRRPGFSRSGSPRETEPIFNTFVERIKKEPFDVLTGQFQADMKVNLCNDGPVTLLLDSEKVF